MSHTPGVDSKLLTAPKTVTCTNLATLGAIMSLGGLQTLHLARLPAVPLLLGLLRLSR